MTTYDFYRGTLITGPRASALLKAAELADMCADLVVVDAAVTTGAELIDFTRRYRSHGHALVVIANTADDVPPAAAANLATVVVLGEAVS